MARAMKLLLLHSEDGQEYIRGILYPADWTEDQATRRAIAAFTKAQRANPDEWSWEDYAPELIARGFTIPDWFHGPTWDRTR